MTRFGKFVSILATGAVAVGLLQSPASAAVVGGNRIVTGPGNTSSFVKLFDPSTLAMNGFTAYPGGLMDVRVAAGDLTGDGVADIATAPGPGGSANVKVFDGVSGAMIRSFFAYVNYNGGVNIALGDVTGDGKADIITGTDGSSTAHVKVFDATN